MKKTLIAAAVLAALSLPASARAKTRDVAFQYRMGAGFPGDVNRTNPFSVEPGLMNSTNPVRLYGDPAIIDTSTNSYRALLSSDTGVTKVDGLLVRPYPTQQQSGGMSASIGAATPPTTAVPADFLREGYMMARCNNFATAQPTKGGAVHVWIAASSGAHVQGGLESAATGGSTIAITNMKWNGPGDANGIAEVIIAMPLA